MQTENRPISVLVDRLNPESRVWLRLAASRPGEEWQLSLLEVTIGEAPPSWRSREWGYERALFAAWRPSGGTVARWLESHRIRRGSVLVRFELGNPVLVERRQSRFAGIVEPLPWPSVAWTVPVRSENRQMLHGELVAPDAPAFLNFDLAAAAFFGVPTVNRNFSGSEIVVREQDRRARIDTVRIRATDVVVAVSGEKLSGAALTLGGEASHTKLLRRGSRDVRFPLAAGIPSGGWLALHRGHELLDRRGLDPGWRHTDVEIEVDALTEIEALISGGEGATTEFKRQLPARDDQSGIVNVMKTIAAFASDRGGTILFGVDDDGTVVGIDSRSDRDMLDRLTSLISDWVRPLVDFEPDLIKLGDRNVLRVLVKAGGEPPYGVGTRDRSVTYYVRRGATTFPATPADVRALVRLRLTAGSPAVLPR